VDAIGGEYGLEAAAGAEFGVGLDGGDTNKRGLASARVRSSQDLI
jgi:hypothetical protein